MEAQTKWGNSKTFHLSRSDDTDDDDDESEGEEEQEVGITEEELEDATGIIGINFSDGMIV